MKKFICVILIICLLVPNSLTAAHGASKNFASESFRSNIESYSLSQVERYILASDSAITINIGGTLVDYYYGDGYVVYEKNNEYFIVMHDATYTTFNINGHNVQATTSTWTQTRSPYAEHFSLQTEWTYMFTDVLFQISVGGLAVEAIMAMIPGGTFANFILEEIASFLLDKAIDSILPNNFAFTIRDDWYYANLDPWLGTVDYSHDLSAWWGFTRDPYMEYIAGDYYTGEIIERL